MRIVLAALLAVGAILFVLIALAVLGYGFLSVRVRTVETPGPTPMPMIETQTSGSAPLQTPDGETTKTSAVFIEAPAR